MVKSTVNITPDKSLLKKLGFTGYQTEHAIAELIDNSIDARTRNNTEIYVTLDFANKTISVYDDGIGMDLDSFRDALTVAKTVKSGGLVLGKFGFGMKSACSALGGNIKIVTATKDSTLEHSIDYDEEEWLNDKARTWENFEITSTKKSRPWHGTRIKIFKIKVAMYPQQSNKLRAKFAQRFAYHIQSDLVTIFVNNTKCVPDRTIDTVIRHDIDIDLKNGNKITGWVGLYPTRNIGSYGFHLYHNRRLIRASDRFGLANHPTLSMMAGELNLEHVPTNYHKTQFIEDSPEYIEAINEFSKNDVVLDIMRKARESTLDTKQSVSGNIVDSNTKIRPNIGLDKAKLMLERAVPFTVSYRDRPVRFTFEISDDDSLYSVDGAGSSYRITINPQSPVFAAIRNPSFLVGMIWAEAKHMIDNPGQHDKFIAERNASWARFVRDASDKKAKRSAPKPTPSHLSHGTLSENLIDVHEVLENSYTHKFQFTALSVLDDYLDNAYGVELYTIITEKGRGKSMHDVLLPSFNRTFTILLHPKHDDILTAIKLSRNAKFIIIRERSDLPLSHIASYEKALADLYREIVKYNTPFSWHELKNIADYMLNNKLVSKQRLHSIARHYGLPESFYHSHEGANKI